MTFTLLGFCCFFLAAATSNVGAVDPIPEAEVEADMQAVGQAIGAPWVEINPSGVHRMETKRESFRLTDAQRALFNRHWEMETIQTQKPTAPEQFNLAMLADALDMVVEMNMPERRVHLRLDKLDAWVAEGPEAEMADLQREEEELRRSEAGEGTEEAAKVPMPEATVDQQGEEMVAANNTTATLLEQAVEGGQPPPVEEEKAGELVHLIREDEEEEEEANLAQCSEDEKPGNLAVADEARQNNTVAPGADGKPFMMIRVQRGGTERRAAGGGGVNFLFPSLMAEMEQQSGEIVEAEPEVQDAGNVLFVVEEEEEESGEEKKEDEAKLAEKKAEEAKQQEEKRREELKQQIADVLTKIEKVSSTAAGNAAGNVTSSEEDEKRIFQQIQVQRAGGGGGEEDVPSSANANAQPAILVVDFARENSAGSEEEQGSGLRVIQVEKLGQEDKTSTEEEEEKEAVEEKALKEKKKEEEKKEEDKKEVAEHKAAEENKGTVGGLMGALSRLLLLNRGKREALTEEQQNQQEQEKQQIMESEMPNVAEEEEEAKKDDGEGNNNKKKKLIMLRSFEGRMAVGANGVLGISTKMMMEMGVDKPMADKDGKEENDEKKTEEEDAEDAGDEKAKAAGEDVPNPASENQPPQAEEEQGNQQEPVETATAQPLAENVENANLPAAAVVQTAPENAAAGAEGVEVPSSAANGEQMPAGLLEIVRAEKEGLKRYFELLVIRAAPGPKRNEKLAYIWYSELQYWIAKRMETDFADVVTAERKDGGNVGELMDSVQAAKPQGIRAKEVDYLRMQWAKTVGRLAQLNDWIGKDFRRRRK